MKNTITLTFFLAISITSFAQPAIWNQLIDAFSVGSTVPIGDSLVCSTNAGVYKCDKAGTGYRFMHLGKDMGVVATDSAERLWCLKYNSGITVYDGSNIIEYNTSNSPLVSDNVMRLNLYKNQVWAFTDLGISVFDGVNWITYDSSNSPIPVGNYVYDVAFTSAGHPWIAMQSYLLNFDLNTWTVYDTASSPLITGAEFSAVAVDKLDRLWFVTTDNGLAGGQASNLNMFDGSQWYDFPSAIYPSDFTTTMEFDTSGRLYLGGITSYYNGWIADGLSVFDGTSWTLYNSSNSTLQQGEINSIVLDSSGTIFISTPLDYISKVNNLNFTKIKITNCSIPSPNITHVAVSDIGKICVSSINSAPWIHWHEEYVTYFDGINWTHTGSHEIHPYFLKFMNDSVAWLGSSEGLFEVKDTIFNEIQIGTLSFGTEARDATIDLSGNIWIATAMGISMYNGSTWTEFNTSNSNLHTDDIYSIAVDSNNVKWIGTSNGLVVYDNTTWTIYDTASVPDLLPYVVNKITVDNHGHVWFNYGTAAWGFEDAGLMMLDVNGTTINSWTSLTDSNSQLPSSWIRDLDYYDSYLWIASDSGLTKSDTSLNMTTFNYSNSMMTDDFIRDVAISSGKLYLATNRFINIVEFDSLQNFVNYIPDESMFAFPNPVSTTIHIKSENKNLQCTILDMNGRILKNANTKYGNGYIDLDVSGLNAGAYMLRATDDIEIKTKIFIVE